MTTTITSELAMPVSTREVHSDCANCGQPIFTIQAISARANTQDAWRHTNTNQQECQAGGNGL